MARKLDADICPNCDGAMIDYGQINVEDANRIRFPAARCEDCGTYFSITYQVAEIKVVREPTGI